MKLVKFQVSNTKIQTVCWIAIKFIVLERKKYFKCFFDKNLLIKVIQILEQQKKYEIKIGQVYLLPINSYLHKNPYVFHMYERIIYINIEKKRK